MDFPIRNKDELVWPETVVIIGAGATASLGMPTTDHQKKSISTMGEQDKELDERLSSAFDGYHFVDAIRDIFTILEADLKDEILESLDAALSRQFPEEGKAAARNIAADLQRAYDWKSLRRIIQTVSNPDAEKSTLIQDIFNLIDYHIDRRIGFRTGAGKVSDRLIPVEALEPARKALGLFMQVLFYDAHQKMLRDPNKLRVFDSYGSFTYLLAELALKEGIEYERNGHLLDSRQFFLSSYAFISMNYDPLFPWLLMNSNRNANISPSTPNVGSPPAPLKLFLDFEVQHGGRLVGGDPRDQAKGRIAYSMDENAAIRLNDPDHASSRRVRISKFYLPHGCLNWRECPNCGKLNSYFGDSWVSTPEP